GSSTGASFLLGPISPDKRGSGARRARSGPRPFLGAHHPGRAAPLVRGPSDEGAPPPGSLAAHLLLYTRSCSAVGVGRHVRGEKLKKVTPAGSEPQIWKSPEVELTSNDTRVMPTNSRS